MTTRLKEVLAYSNVDILSDPDYMLYKDQIQEEVKQWHKTAKRTDRYLTWKLNFALDLYPYEELVEAIQHVGKNPMKFDQTVILERLKEIDENRKSDIRQINE